jgi:hypothetical protein
MLKISDVQQPSDQLCIVDIDPHVPITFMTRRHPVGGARYIRLGNFKTHLLDLEFPPDSLALSGFVVVSIDNLARGLLKGGGPKVSGLPVFGLPAGCSFSVLGGFARLDVPIAFELSCEGDIAEIRIGDVIGYDRRICFQRVEWLLWNDSLVGMRVLNLTADERKVLCEYKGT